MKVHPKYASKVSVQQYSAKKEIIAGVEIHNLALHGDDGGNFAEIFRLTGNKIDVFSTPFEVKQVSMSVLVVGAIKAYHLHFNQDDAWFVSPFDRLLVNLHDVRENSDTFDMHMRFTLGGGAAKLLRIPKGVAHGVANPYDRPMSLYYATSQIFDLKNPDEQRLPWDVYGSSLWEIQKG